MFDVSFSELLLIGIIALVVIGPERLPGVARTIGHLVGRAQRYVNDVKADIQREVDLGEITNLKDQMSEAANSVKASLESVTKDLHQPMAEAQDAFKDAADSVNSLVADAQASVQKAADQVRDTAQPAGDAATTAGAKPLADTAPPPDLPQALGPEAKETVQPAPAPAAAAKPKESPAPAQPAEPAPEPTQASNPSHPGTPT